MLAQWICQFYVRKKSYGVTNKDLAVALGNSETWVSDVLNGKRTSKNSEQRFNEALDKLIAEKNT